MSTGEAWTLGRRPALDGLRGVAIVLVVVAHAYRGTLGIYGTSGVTVFFTLSGFLITSLLLEERARSGAICLRGFYRRRALRLAPALVFFLAVMLLAATALGDDFVTPGDALPALLYVTNWVMAFGGDAGLFSHTWSLSVEEQFYLVWPFVVILACRSRHWRGILLGVAATGILWAVVARGILWDGGAGHMRVYMGSDTRADSILIGCALAVAMHGSQRGRAYSRLGGALVACLVVYLWVEQTEALVYLGVPFVVAIFTALVIGLVAQDGYRGFLASRPWVAIGKRSYSWYLWNGIGFHLLLPHMETWPRLSGVAVIIGGSFVVACFSYRFVEQPFLRRKHRSHVHGDEPRRAAVGTKPHARAVVAEPDVDRAVSVR